jgi:acetyl esterase/lipase
MDTELAAILAGLPPLVATQASDARAVARQHRERVGLAVSGRDDLAVSDQWVPGPAGDPDVLVRVYDPPRGAGSRACLVYFHGGGFIAGDLDTEDVRCVVLAKHAGCVVVSVDYRLAPEHPYPAALDDGEAALRWASSSAATLEVDPARIGVGGGSAGGTLAAGLALRARDRGGPPLAFQLLVYPALDDRLRTASMRAVGTPVIDGRSVAYTWDSYLGTARADVAQYAAPARAESLAGLPPTYLMTAELDPLRDEGIEYATRLLHAGVSVELHQFGGAFHGFDLFPTTISRRARDEQVAWLWAITQTDSHDQGDPQ